MVEPGALATIASIVAALGTAMLFFRSQRELLGSPQSIPWAERLLLCATLSSLWLVLLPLVALNHASPWVAALERAACAASTIMVSGYVFAILGHYRSLGSGPGRSAESSERLCVWVTLAAAAAAFVWILFAVHGHLNEPSL